MSYKIVQTNDYKKKLIKFVKKHLDMISQYAKTITLLASNPFHLSLRLHKLQGKFEVYHNVYINIKYRVILEIIIKDEELLLVDIGLRDDVY